MIVMSTSFVPLRMNGFLIHQAGTCGRRIGRRRGVTLESSSTRLGSTHQDTSFAGRAQNVAGSSMLDVTAFLHAPSPTLLHVDDCPADKRPE
jgi:hypothetical protein